MVLLPFAGALILAIFGASMPKKAAGAIGCASIGISWSRRWLPAISDHPSGADDHTTLYNWINAGSLRVGMSACTSMRFRW